MKIFSSLSAIGIFVFSLLSVNLSAQCISHYTTGVITVNSLPFQATGRTTCGSGDSLSTSNTASCGSGSFFQNAEEDIYIVSPTASDSFHIFLRGNRDGVALTLFEGCPLSGSGGSCLGRVRSLTNRVTLLEAYLELGKTYYVVVSNSFGGCFSYDIDIIKPPTCPSGLGSNLVQINQLPFTSNGRSTCGKGNILNQANTISCQTNGNLNGEEEIFAFTPTTSDSFHFFLSSSSEFSGLYLFEGCPLLGQGGSCVGSNTRFNQRKLLEGFVEQGKTYYVVVSSTGGCISYDLQIQKPLTCPTGLGSNLVQVNQLPYSSNNRTTCGKGNLLNDVNTITCQSNNYLNGEEEVFIISPNTTDSFHINISSNSQFSGLYLFEGCPFIGQGGSCVGSNTRLNQRKLLEAYLEQGKTYYLVVSSTGGCISYDLQIKKPLSCPTGLGSNLVQVNQLPYSSNNRTTCGKGNILNDVNTTTCQSNNYLNGEEEVFVISPNTTDSFHINISSNSQFSGLYLFEGCPFIGQGGNCLGSDTRLNRNKLLESFMEQGKTYYLVVSSNGGCISYDLNIRQVCGIPPPTLSSYAPFCPNDSSALVSIVENIGLIQWYYDPGLTRLIDTGKIWKPFVNVTETYYVTHTGRCQSIPTAVPIQFLTAPAISVQDLNGQLKERNISFASDIISFSSRQSATDGSPSKATGKPDVYPAYGANQNAWRPLSENAGREYLTLSFNQQRPVNGIAIYETFNPGSIDTVYIRNAQNGEWTLIWSGVASRLNPVSNIFQIEFPLTSYPVDAVKICMNTGAVNGFNQIDAVGLYVTEYMVCQNDTLVLKVQQSDQYLWNNGSSQQDIITVAGQNTSFSVNTQSNQCSFKSDIHLKVLPNITPEKVERMLPENNSINIDKPIRFSWKEAQHATHYDLFVWEKDSVKPQTAIRSYIKGTGVEALFPELEYGQNYQWSVQSKNHECGAVFGDTQTFQLRYLPDLVVRQVEIPTTTVSGENITVSWETHNVGKGSTLNGIWEDAIFLSLQPTFDLETAILLGTVENTTSLFSGHFYKKTTQVEIPFKLSGKYYVFVSANYSCFSNTRRGEANAFNDCIRLVKESDEDNNLMSASSSLQINIPQLPDVEPVSLNVNNNLFAGELANITFSVKNKGLHHSNSQHPNEAFRLCGTCCPMTAGMGRSRGNIILCSEFPCTPSILAGRRNDPCFFIENIWYDALFLSTSPTLSQDDIIPIAIIPSNLRRISFFGSDTTFRPIKRDDYASQDLFDEAKDSLRTEWLQYADQLFKDSSYTKNISIKMPDCLSGTYYLHLATDIYNHIWEINDNNNIISTTAINIIRNPPSDLTVTQVQSVDSIRSGETIMLNWQVQNQGLNAPNTDSWVDSIFLSKSSTFNPSTSIPIGAHLITRKIKSLPADSSYAVTKRVTIPNGLDGPYYLHVFTDAQNVICEFDENNNVRSTIQPIHITLTPPPDLIVQDILLPNAVYAGTPFPLKYILKNKGTGKANAWWSDHIYVSESPVFVMENALFVDSIRVNQPLQASDTTLLSTTITIPITDFGNKFIHVITNYSNRVYEHGKDTNNTKTIPINIQYPLLSDIRVADVPLSDTLHSGEKITLEVLIENIKPHPTSVAVWYDTLFVSTTPTKDMNAIPIGNVIRRNGLDSMSSYIAYMPIKVPDGLEGDFYFIYMSDARNNIINDTSRGNNVFVKKVHIKRSAYPNLIIEHMNVPAEIFAGESFVLPFSYKNIGVAAYENTIIYRAGLGLTDDDAAKTSIGWRTNVIQLSPGETISDSIWVQIPVNAVGNMTFVLNINHHLHTFEFPENDGNTAKKVLLVRIPPPSDLTIGSLTFPKETIPGKLEEVSFYVKNKGNNDAIGTHTHWLQVGDQRTFSPSNPSMDIMSDSRSRPIKPGDSALFISRSYVPGVKEGEYYGIVKTNIKGNIREENYENNEGFSSTTSTIDIFRLQENQWKSDSIETGSFRLYRIPVTEGKDLRIQVETSSNKAISDVYVMPKRVPTRTRFTQRTPPPSQQNHTVLVPETESGFYYIMVDLTSPNTENITSWTGNNLGARVIRKENIQIKVESLSYQVMEINPSKLGQGRVTTTIKGAGFREGIKAFLKDQNNQTVSSAQWVQRVNSMELKVRWELDSVAVGTYDLVLVNPGGEEARLTQGVEVEVAKAYSVNVLSTSSDVVGARSTAYSAFHVINDGNTDIPYIVGNILFEKATTLITATGSSNVNLNPQLYQSFLAEKDSISEFIYSIEENFYQIPMYNVGLAPGEEYSITFNFKNFPYETFPVEYNLNIYDDEEILIYLNFSIELLRRNLESNPLLAENFRKLPHNNEISNYISDTSLFFWKVIEIFIQNNLILADDTTGFAPCFACLDDIFDDLENAYYSELNTPTYEDENLMNSFNKKPKRPYDRPAPACRQGNPINYTCTNIMPYLPCIASVICIVASGGIFSLACILPFTDCFLFIISKQIEKGQTGANIPTKNSKSRRSQSKSSNTGKASNFSSGVCLLVTAACDPNDILGPAGYGEEQFVSVNDRLNYTIRFENDPELANAPAQEVIIRQPLDSNANPLSFRLGSFGFAGMTFDVPENTSFYSNRIRLNSSHNFDLNVIAGIDIDKNEAFWQFSTIDPATGFYPNNPFIGFLPINDSSGIGEGFVKYAITPRNTLVTGDIISATADIYFDLNPPITTNTHFNTIDAFPPQIQVNAIDSIQPFSTILISATAADDLGGSGLKNFDLYASKNGSSFTYVSTSIKPEFVYMGEECSRYDFYIIATDNVGNRRRIPSKPDIQTLVGKPGLNIGGDTLICKGQSVTLTANTGMAFLWNTGETTRTITVRPDSSATYSVIASDTSSCPYFASVLITVDECAHVPPPPIIPPSLKVYPNPSMDLVTIQLHHLQSHFAFIEITDMMGSVILSETFDVKDRTLSQSYHLQHLPGGIYLIKAGDHSIRLSEKIILIK
jgi:hypothetical protein